MDSRNVKPKYSVVNESSIDPIDASTKEIGSETYNDISTEERVSETPKAISTEDSESKMSKVADNKQHSTVAISHITENPNSKNLTTASLEDREITYSTVATSSDPSIDTAGVNLTSSDHSATEATTTTTSAGEPVSSTMPSDLSATTTSLSTSITTDNSSATIPTISSSTPSISSTAVEDLSASTFISSRNSSEESSTPSSTSLFTDKSSPTTAIFTAPTEPKPSYPTSFFPIANEKSSSSTVDNQKTSETPSASSEKADFSAIKSSFVSSISSSSLPMPAKSHSVPVMPSLASNHSLSPSESFESTTNEDLVFVTTETSPATFPTTVRKEEFSNYMNDTDNTAPRSSHQIHKAVESDDKSELVHSNHLAEGKGSWQINKDASILGAVAGEVAATNKFDKLKIKSIMRSNADVSDQSKIKSGIENKTTSEYDNVNFDLSIDEQLDATLTTPVENVDSGIVSTSSGKLMAELEEFTTDGVPTTNNRESEVTFATETSVVYIETSSLVNDLKKEKSPNELAVENEGSKHGNKPINISTETNTTPQVTIDEITTVVDKNDSHNIIYINKDSVLTNTQLIKSTRADLNVIEIPDIRKKPPKDLELGRQNGGGTSHDGGYLTKAKHMNVPLEMYLSHRFRKFPW